MHKPGQPFMPGKTDPKAWSDEHSVTIKEPSLTVQDHTADTNINVIMERARLTGRMPDPNTTRLPTYDDYTNVVDYATAMNSAIAASDAFMRYPAEFRAKFQNDPQQFALWALTPENRGELYRYGLLNDAARAQYEKDEAARAAAAAAAREPARPASSTPGGTATPPTPGTPGTT